MYFYKTVIIWVPTYLIFVSTVARIPVLLQIQLQMIFKIGKHY